jgi:hypothetical protein
MARGPPLRGRVCPVEVETPQGVLPSARLPEAHVSLPGQRPDQGARADVEHTLQVPVRTVCKHCRPSSGRVNRPSLKVSRTTARKSGQSVGLSR